MTDTTVPQPPLKCCSKCKLKKPATTQYFGIDRRHKDGLLSSCRECKNLYYKSYYENNCERIRQQHKEYDSAHREEKLEYNRQYYADHVDKLRASARENSKRRYRANPNAKINQTTAYARANRDKARSWWNKYAAKHPNERAAVRHARRAREQAASGEHNAADIREVVANAHGMCWWCGEKVDPKRYHIDHRIPLARGGSNSPDNLCVSCASCNLSKGTKLPQEWNGRLL